MCNYYFVTLCAEKCLLRIFFLCHYCKVDMDVIERNFFGLLARSAFDENFSTIPMSSWKWHKLAYLAVIHDVWIWLRRSIVEYKSDQNLNIPFDFDVTVYDKIAESNTSVKTNRMRRNKFLMRGYRKIVEKERHSIDTSIDTQYLLDLIVNNAETMLNSGLSIKGLIELGVWIRSRGQNVDFVKLEKWLNHLQLQGFASLEASLLVVLFNFEMDELPFATRFRREAEAIAEQALRNKRFAEEWHFRQSDSGFVVNNSKQLRRSMRRSLRFFHISPVLAVSNSVYNFIYSLKEIEE